MSEGISVAISPSGIKYFIDSLLTDQLTNALQQLRPPDKTVSIDAGLTCDAPTNRSAMRDVQVELPACILLLLCGPSNNLAQPGILGSGVQATSFGADHAERWRPIWHHAGRHKFYCALQMA